MVQVVPIDLYWSINYSRLHIRLEDRGLCDWGLSRVNLSANYQQERRIHLSMGGVRLTNDMIQ